MGGKGYELILKEFASEYGQMAVLTISCFHLRSVMKKTYLYS